MKTKMMLGLAVAVVLGVGLTACVSEKVKQERLEAKAKVSKADAQKTAMAKVPNGTVKAGEIEEEDGKLIWSFDLNTPGTKDITEVTVNAMTGEVVSVDKESAADEKKEKD